MFDKELAEKLDSNEMINLFKADPPCEAAIWSWEVQMQK